jgi:hypothetical protein
MPDQIHQGTVNPRIFGKAIGVNVVITLLDRRAYQRAEMIFGAERYAAVCVGLQVGEVD